jgi:hypothetical protein
LVKFAKRNNNYISCCWVMSVSLTQYNTQVWSLNTPPRNKQKSGRKKVLAEHFSPIFCTCVSDPTCTQTFVFYHPCILSFRQI